MKEGSEAHRDRRNDISCTTIMAAGTLLPTFSGEHALLNAEDTQYSALTIGTLLQGAGLKRDEVLLLRHKDSSAAKGRSPYELWRDERILFLKYQSVQNKKARKKFSRPYWASFVVNAFEENVFAGIWKANRLYEIEQEHPMVQSPGDFDPPHTLDQYDMVLTYRLSDLIGKLTIDWGPGKLAWAQYAEKNDKVVLEIKSSTEEPFPGFLNFIEPLSRIPLLPKTWISALSKSKGVYLLTCPRTREQYVGSASGENGFYGRWMEYAANGHGGNVKLKSKNREDYQVSILEVASSSSGVEDITKLEGRWQKKLQSHLMGLNSGLAKK